ncbi:MAG: hypothetical protein ACE37F_09660 [Nannocystaceae bacterium]|nr:hypothetical protein [bacterium]
MPIARFELDLADGGAAAKLRFDGAAVPGTADGRVIEAQFEVRGRYLVVLSDDVPYEERLVFVLFDEAPALLDSLEFGAAYTPGLFRLVNTTDAPSVVFTFEGDTRYALHIHDAPHRRLSTLPGVRRPGGPFRKHHLELKTA